MVKKLLKAGFVLVCELLLSGWLFVYLPLERQSECVYSALYGELSTNAQPRAE